MQHNINKNKTIKTDKTLTRTVCPRGKRGCVSLVHDDASRVVPHFDTAAVKNIHIVLQMYRKSCTFAGEKSRRGLPANSKVYIAISGNIGAGKTTLTKMLARYYGWEPRFESVTFNPYLEDYYHDIKRWSFCLETYFLKERFKDMLAISQATHTIVQDRSIFEGVYVFVTNNYRRGDLSERDYETYMELFGHMKRLMKMPDLMIYLRKSVPSLIAQIQKRGRAYEASMQLDYLRDLNERYEDFIFRQYEGRVLVIESDNMDFENNPEDFRQIINKIDAQLFGLFSEDTWKQGRG